MSSSTPLTTCMLQIPFEFSLSYLKADPIMVTPWATCPIYRCILLMRMLEVLIESTAAVLFNGPSMTDKSYT